MIGSRNNYIYFNQKLFFFLPILSQLLSREVTDPNLIAWNGAIFFHYE